MKLLALGIVVFALAWIPYSSWYPFGYPVKKEDVWRITWIYHEGTPIEKVETSIVVVDSTFEGYVIKTHIQGTNQIYTDGEDMRAFLGTWGHSWPDKAELLQRSK